MELCRHGVGYDYIQNDASGSNMRLDVRSQLKYVYGFPALVPLVYSCMSLISSSSSAIL